VAAVVVLVIFAAAAVSYVYNRTLEIGPEAVGQLGELDKARLHEAARLRREFGDEVWPGWGTNSIPVMVTDGTFDYLIGHPEPPDSWFPVEDDEFDGSRYYARAHEDTGEHALKVNGHWTAVSRTKGATDRLVVNEISETLPPIAAQVFPYRLILQPTEVYLGDLLHDHFHAHLASVVESRYEAANSSYWSIGSYPLGSSALRPDAEAEIAALTAALNSTDLSSELAAQHASAFLDARARRRQLPELDEWSTGIERDSEWLKGLAKYSEMETLRRAYESESFASEPDMARDEAFEEYENYEELWASVLSSMELSLDQGRIMRFHYTGMAQAVLLDALGVEWKAAVLEPGVFVEDLLRDATVNY
jgi:hypothetical protein